MVVLLSFNQNDGKFHYLISPCNKTFAYNDNLQHVKALHAMKKKLL
jgi:hypothetical protein